MAAAVGSVQVDEFIVVIVIACRSLSAMCWSDAAAIYCVVLCELLARMLITAEDRHIAVEGDPLTSPFRRLGLGPEAVTGDCCRNGDAASVAAAKRGWRPAARAVPAINWTTALARTTVAVEGIHGFRPASGRRTVSASATTGEGSRRIAHPL